MIKLSFLATIPLNELALRALLICVWAQAGVQVCMEERGGRSDWLATMETPHRAGGSECTSLCCCSGYSPLLQQPTPLFVSVLPMKNTGDQAACHDSRESMCVCMCAFMAVYNLPCGVQRISVVYTAEHLCPIIRVICAFTTTGNKCHNLLTFQTHTHMKTCEMYAHLQ